LFTRARALIEPALISYAPRACRDEPSKLDQAIEYALCSGGKRLRPLLTLYIVDALGVDPQSALPVAVAIEYVHTSSLIIDDLPMMDNSPLRRGRPALHVQYGQAAALLAAIALLNRAYEIVLEIGTAAAIQVHRYLTESIGSAGMIRGQMADLAQRFPLRAANSGKRMQPDDVMLKTTSLFRLALTAGALCASAAPSTVLSLESYATALGTAFQLHDDWQDMREDALCIQGMQTADPDSDVRRLKNELREQLRATTAIASRTRPRSLSVALLELANVFAEMLGGRQLDDSVPESDDRATAVQGTSLFVEGIGNVY
jgi:geranylgeranyl pyrophosphate synthase